MTVQARNHVLRRSAGSCFNAALGWLGEARTTTGTAPDDHSPNATIIRAQMAVFLWRNAGPPASSGPHGFADVPSGPYYENAMTWLVEAGPHPRRLQRPRLCGPGVVSTDGVTGYALWELRGVRSGSVRFLVTARPRVWV